MNQEKYQKIEKLVKEKPKHFAAMIKRTNELYEEIVPVFGETIPEKVYNYLHQIDEASVTCEKGKTRAFNTVVLGYWQFCGTKSTCECARAAHSERIIQVSAERTEEEKQAINKKKQATCVKNHGVTHPSKSPEIRTRMEETCIKNHGAKTPFESASVQQKIQEKCLENYGVRHPFQSKEIRKKGQDACKSKYGHVMGPARAALYEKFNGLNPFQVPEIKEKANNTRKAKTGYVSPKHVHLTIEQVETLTNKEKFDAVIAGKSLKVAALDLGVYATTVARYCDKHDSRHLIVSDSRSVLEERIKRFLDSLDVKYVNNTKQIISPFELDFYLPEFNVAIEVGSLFTHSELSAGRGEKYHKNKWKMCKEKGIDLVQWFDDDFKNHWPVIENKIKYLTNNITTKIGARKVTISPVELRDERQFLEENHIQGFSSDRSYVFGGYYKDQLVAVMTFANRKNKLELTRYATKLGAVYPGLFSKLLVNARTVLPELPIISFSANNHSNGKLYRSSGFTQKHHVNATYFYTSDYRTKQARNNFMKSKLLKKYPDLDPSKTEWELVQELGYDRIWDSGKIAWVLE